MSCPFSSLSKHKDIFGKPKEGIHKKRLFGFAFSDVIGTIIIAVIITFLFKGFSFIRFIKIFVLLFLLAQVLHVMFCVNTTFVNKVLGIKFSGGDESQ